MTVEARYKHLLLQTARENLRVAREQRVRVRELTAQLRKRAEESVVTEPPVGEETGPAQVQLMITQQMRQQLEQLGWEPSDVKRMTPEQARDIIEESYTKEKKEQHDTQQEQLLEKHENKVIKALEKAKKRLALLEHKYKTTENLIEGLYDKIADLEDNSDGSDKAQRKLDLYHKNSEKQQENLSNLEDQIRAQNQIIQQIVSQEDDLIDDLQEAHETAMSTPGQEDNEILQDRIREFGEVLDTLQQLRQKIWGKDKKDSGAAGSLERAREQLFELLREQEQMLDRGKVFRSNELDDEIESAERQVEELDEEFDRLVRLLMKQENTLKSKRTEKSIEQEVDEVYEDLPEFAKNLESLKEESKKDIEEDDPGQEAAKKTQFYKDRTEAIGGFVQKFEPQFREFISQFIGPDIPSDPKVEKALNITNSGIIKRATAMQQLADRYKRNDMHRSAILLPGVLYEMLAKNMQAVLDLDQEQKEAQAIYKELREAGFLTEANLFGDLWDKTKAVGRGVGKGIKKFDEGLGKVNRAVDDKTRELWDKTKETVDQQRFKRQDKAPRREFDKPIEEARKNLQQLQQVERSLQSQLAEANQLLQEAGKEAQPDPREIRRIEQAIKEIQSRLHAVGEKKDVLEKGLAHKPAPGAMRGQEQAAKSPKSDHQHAVALMEEAKPDMVKLMALIPDDASLEQELVRQSDRIAKLAQKLVQVGFKFKKKYPNLPPTILAYGHMFLAIDDALNRALRSNEGISA